jgi:K(+)-stimulated pyrophosphate-energized sodium pump
MGADLYESYCGSILSTAALGAVAFAAKGTAVQFNGVIAPMVIAAVGIILSVVGIFMVKSNEDASQKQLLSSLSRGINFSAVFIAIFSFFILKYLNIPNYLGIWGSMLAGLFGGVAIGKITEYFHFCRL